MLIIYPQDMRPTGHQTQGPSSLTYSSPPQLGEVWDKRISGHNRVVVTILSPACGTEVVSSWSGSSFWEPRGQEVQLQLVVWSPPVRWGEKESACV